jgi:hypothetical protein
MLRRFRAAKRRSLPNGLAGTIRILYEFYACPNSEIVRFNRDSRYSTRARLLGAPEDDELWFSYILQV